MATKSQLESQLEDVLQVNLEWAEAFEHTQSELAVVQRRLDDVYYLNLNDTSTDKEYDVLPVAKKREIIRRLRILRQENPLAKQAMKLAIRFTFGKGVSFVVKNKESRKVLNQFWSDAENAAVLTSHDSMKERFDELLTDGEKFIVMFKGTVPPYIRLGEIPMEEMNDIIYHPENRFVPVYYKRVYFKKRYDAKANDGRGEWVKEGQNGDNTKPFITYYRDYRITDDKLGEIEDLQIPESMVEADAFVRHRMVNPTWQKSGRRGVSELFASREWFRVFKEFMEDRGAINAAANAFSYVRKVKGGQAAVASIKGKVGSMTTGLDESSLPRRMTRPVAGAFYDINEAMDVTALRADTGAVDAKEDARMILMTGGAGVGTMLPYFGEGGDANLATAQAMELPMVKAYEDYQTEVKNDLDAISIFVLEAHYGITRTEAISQMDTDEPEDTEADGSKIIPINNKTKPPVVPAREAEDPVAPFPPKEAEPAESGDEENGDAIPRVEQLPPIDDRFIVSWEMPPIISQDVVKYMTAWTQLAGQIAPGNKIVKQVVIRGALNTMAVPNAEEMMEQIMAEEELVEAEKARKAAEMEARFAESGVPMGEKGPQPSGAPDPLGPDLKRISNGKPPRVPATGGRLSARQGF